MDSNYQFVDKESVTLGEEGMCPIAYIKLVSEEGPESSFPALFPLRSPSPPHTGVAWAWGLHAVIVQWPPSGLVLLLFTDTLPPDRGCPAGTAQRSLC